MVACCSVHVRVGSEIQYRPLKRTRISHCPLPQRLRAGLMTAVAARLDFLLAPRSAFGATEVAPFQNPTFPHQT